MEQMMIPDVLQMRSGARVGGAEAWGARRAEILELFTREVYGRIPFVDRGIRA